MTPMTVVLQRNHENQSRDETLFHPSEATRCKRETFYKKKKARNPNWDIPIMPVSSNLLLIFEIGHILHNWVQTCFVTEGLCTMNEIEMKIRDEKAKLTGSVDIFLPVRERLTPYDETFPNTGRVVDIKTCSWKSFSEYRGVEHAYKVQTSLYCYYLGVTDATILYLCKDGGSFDYYIKKEGIESFTKTGVEVKSITDPGRISIRVSHLTRNDRLVQAALQSFAEIERCLETDTPPDPDFSPFESVISPCLSCVYRKVCEKETGRKHPKE